MYVAPPSAAAAPGTGALSSVVLRPGVPPGLALGLGPGGEDGEEDGRREEDDLLVDTPPEIIALLQQDEVMLVLEEMADWNFNAFRLTELTDGHPLATLGFVLFEEHDFYAKYRIDPKRFYAFLLETEYAYLWNPYHNRTHAADVLASLNMLLVGGGVIDGGYCDDLALFTALLAAILHDYGHPGLNNDFLTKASASAPGRVCLCACFPGFVRCERHPCARPLFFGMPPPTLNMRAPCRTTTVVGPPGHLVQRQVRA